MEKRTSIETDAVPTSTELRPVTETAGSAQNELDLNGIVNQSLIVEQRNQTTNFTINNSNGLTFGTVINIGNQPPFPEDYEDTIAREKKIYGKTPTIKEMMGCNDIASSTFLQLVADNLGKRWKEFTILIEPNIMFTERMEVDYMDRGGSSEIVMQVMTKFFRENQDKQTIGWLTTFLWKKNFRCTVHMVKDPYKDLRDLDSD